MPLGDIKVINRTMIALAFAGLLTGAAFGFLALKNSSPPGEGQVIVTDRPAVGGPFSLIDNTGKRVTDKDYLGHYMLVFFGYTNCPDICPAGLQIMSAALDKLGKRADDIVPIFITLDPARDTQEKMATYVKAFSPKLVGLTGSESDIAATAKAYRVYYQKVSDDNDPKNYTVDHSAIFYLMGKDGKLLAPIPHTNDVDQLVSALDRALS
ncbi:MAG: SCO family protein [Hyphomicrobium sp.]|uniref:SCO family protein n=1 Tax=Hyphomicrobium sp. TaxID=82 RepID=UPI0039E25924